MPCHELNNIQASDMIKLFLNQNPKWMITMFKLETMQACQIKYHTTKIIDRHVIS